VNLIERINREQISRLTSGKVIPNFRAGDSVKVLVAVDGNRERMQSFEGVVIARKSRSINSSFKVRKVSNGEGVERLFHLYSPNIQIQVLKHGRVRRAKLYYLRQRTGKRTRIAEKKRNEPVIANAE
jgi:large subunit ribosomal protein L19